MERSVAIKKLGKLLGKSFGYRVDPRAPSRDEREEAQAQLPAANEMRKVLTEKMEARRRAILEADAEYQQLKTDCEAARKRSDKLLGTSHHYRFTVGNTVGGMFFSVKAQGDSWEEVIEKLTTKQDA